MLIATEIFFDLLRAGNISLGNGKPSLVNSIFGWIVGGSYNHNNKSKAFLCNVAVKSSHINLDILINKFWEIEEFQQSKSKISTDEQHAEKHFLQNTKINNNGRIMVRLPFKSTPRSLGNSFINAQKRFYNADKIEVQN